METELRKSSHFVFCFFTSLFWLTNFSDHCPDGDRSKIQETGQSGICLPIGMVICLFSKGTQQKCHLFQGPCLLELHEKSVLVQLDIFHTLFSMIGTCLFEMCFSSVRDWTSTSVTVWANSPIISTPQSLDSSKGRWQDVHFLPERESHNLLESWVTKCEKWAVPEVGRGKNVW